MKLKPTVMKFGGTSVENADAFERLTRIVRAHTGSPAVVVVSAMAGVTDALLECFSLASNGDISSAERLLDQHLGRHAQVASALLKHPNHFDGNLSSAQEELLEFFNSTKDRSLPLPLLQDLIVSYGERLSASLLALILNADGMKAKYVDARRCIETDGEQGKAEPLLEQTVRRTRAELEPLIGSQISDLRSEISPIIPVLGGFIAATSDGTTTTLGRGGSDYTAALIGAALEAEEIQIWTDVSGVLTADPRVLPDAQTIPRLSYAEAAELAYFGAKVLHPKTIQPAVELNIPVRICNARMPDADGTIVCGNTEVSPQSVKAIAHKTGITLVQITSARMLGAHGFLRAIFEIFDRHRTAIDIVTTSEVSVSLSLDDTTALPAIVHELKQLGAVRVETDRAIVCVVGEGLRNTPGIAARIFGCVSDINVSLISQGASSINLTFVVDEQHVREVVSRLHETFLLSGAARLQMVHG